VPDNYLTTREAAERLALGVSTIRKLCAAGQFPGAQRVGCGWIIPAADLSRLPALPKPRNRPRKTAP
jgi:excisionase family DNA binding protein